MDEDLKKVALFVAKTFLEANGYYVARRGEMVIMDPDGIRKIEYEPVDWGGSSDFDRYIPGRMPGRSPATLHSPPPDTE